MFQQVSSGMGVAGLKLCKLLAMIITLHVKFVSGCCQICLEFLVLILRGLKIKSQLVQLYSLTPLLLLVWGSAEDKSTSCEKKVSEKNKIAKLQNLQVIISFFLVQNQLTFHSSH